MMRSLYSIRIAVALCLVATWLVGDLGAPLQAKRGLEAGRVGRGVRDVDVHVHNRRPVGAYGRREFWDEAEDRHQRQVVAGVIGGIVIGALVAKPPKDAQPTVVSGQQYYYSDGSYYQPEGDQYKVVSPPMGAEVDSVPAGAKSLEVEGDTYLAFGDVYYRVYYRGSDPVYQVVPNPIG